MFASFIRCHCSSDLNSCPSFSLWATAHLTRVNPSYSLWMTAPTPHLTTPHPILPPRILSMSPLFDATPQESVCTFARALHVLERECAGSLSVYLQRFEDAHVVV
jgi:hypothetical protein